MSGWPGVARQRSRADMGRRIEKDVTTLRLMPR
jgi:hypothetical protein